MEIPHDNYTFAGEIPWHSEFAMQYSEDEPGNLYSRQLWIDDKVFIEFETLAHCYDWENYHSVLNQARGSLIPSQVFSNTFDLRAVPSSFSQTQADGNYAAISIGAPNGFDGHLLYLREDLLHQYASGRSLIWVMHGERQIYPFPDPMPDWLDEIRVKDEDSWGIIRKGEDLSQVFSAKPLRRRRKSTPR